MPDLGTYAQAVGLAYAGALPVLGLLVFWVWNRSRRLSRQLAALESRLKRG